ncbi:MAG: hypothetical protein PHG20_13070 [Geobacteraceae bacterium]|nr:hypothetical protein [Geobacteraceae bacterium]
MIVELADSAIKDPFKLGEFQEVEFYDAMEWLPDVIEKCVHRANETGKKVLAIFNEDLLIIHPGDKKEKIYQEWSKGREGSKGR